MICILVPQEHLLAVPSLCLSAAKQSCESIACSVDPAEKDISPVARFQSCCGMQSQPLTCHQFPRQSGLCLSAPFAEHQEQVTRPWPPVLPSSPDLDGPSNLWAISNSLIPWLICTSSSPKTKENKAKGCREAEASEPMETRKRKMN